MAFKGITFSGQNVTPKNDGGLYQAHYGDGILWGCSMNISGDDLVIQSGEFIAGGRVCHVDGATNVDLSGRGLTTGYIQVIMNYDLTQGEGLQWYESFVESASTTFPTLTQDDINDTGTLYQVELAVVQISGGNLTAVTSSMGNSFVVVKHEGNTKVNIGGGANSGVLQFYENDGTTLNGRLSRGNLSIIFDNPNAGSLVLYDSGPTYLNGDQINIRPNNDAVNQTIVNADGTWDFGGQIRGGLTRHSTTKNSTTSIPSGTTFTLVTTLTGLDSSGWYIYDVRFGFTPSASGNLFPRGRIGTADNYQYMSFSTANTSLNYLSMQGIITGSTTLPFYVSTFASSISASVSAGVTITAVRIG